MNQVKLGIIGLGNMGSGHCNNILAGLTPELKLTAAADLRQARPRRCRPAAVQTRLGKGDAAR
ncbi:putative uncharacterized protein [Firmicutes bacterium CAG:24]|nr:putative uncharacterized protein [Firmicutes bacterium CAG:24]